METLIGGTEWRAASGPDALTDTKTWLPDDLLVKADKMTMANSLELRVPLLDHKVLEFAASLPPDFKVGNGQTKRILRAAFARGLPGPILNRKKAGFPVPYEGWLRREFKGEVADTLLSDQALSRGYSRQDELERLLKTNSLGPGNTRRKCSVCSPWNRGTGVFADARPANSCSANQTSEILASATFRTPDFTIASPHEGIHEISPN